MKTCTSGNVDKNKRTFDRFEPSPIPFAYRVSRIARFYYILAKLRWLIFAPMLQVKKHINNAFCTTPICERYRYFANCCKNKERTRSEIYNYVSFFVEQLCCWLSVGKNKFVNLLLYVQTCFVRYGINVQPNKVWLGVFRFSFKANFKAWNQIFEHEALLFLFLGKFKLVNSRVKARNVINFSTYRTVAIIYFNFSEYDLVLSNFSY